MAAAISPETAEIVKEQILQICRRHGLWFKIEEVHKPDLQQILIKEISIKVSSFAK